MLMPPAARHACIWKRGCKRTRSGAIPTDSDIISMITAASVGADEPTAKQSPSQPARVSLRTWVLMHPRRSNFHLSRVGDCFGHKTPSQRHLMGLSPYQEVSIPALAVGWVERQRKPTFSFSTNPILREKNGADSRPPLLHDLTLPQPFTQSRRQRRQDVKHITHHTVAC